MADAKMVVFNRFNQDQAALRPEVTGGIRSRPRP